MFELTDKMRISERQIEDIRSGADIVDVVSGFVQLRKRGKNFIGLCPFHSEKTPSFTVSGEKQIYHCFGCGSGGNVFKFLMEFKNISFVEAIEELADHLGIKLEKESSGDSALNDELEEYYEINIAAARFFSDNLLKSTNGEEAREYLKKRQIKSQIQKTFGLGYAPHGWDNFLSHAKENKINLQKAKVLGLIDTKDNNDFYDKYRGRIIFPIFSQNGRVIAFGGRIFPNQDNVAKYLNSPESPVYSKRKSLYGLFHSKEEIRKLDRAILVEGYMDLISLYQAGVKNVVASSGTSLTEEQVQLLARFTKNIIILFDADAAGEKAALRSIEILLKQNFEVKVMTLPKGEDPDSFINKNGKEKFEELAAKSKNFLEYQTQQFEDMGLFEDAADSAKAIRELVRTLALVTDDLKRNLLLKSISKKFNLREKLIESELNTFLEQNRKQSQLPQKQDSKQYSNKPPDSLEFAQFKEENPFEKEIVRLLFSGDMEIIEHIFDVVSVESFSNKKYHDLVAIVSEGYNSNNISPAYLIEKIENDEIRKFIFGLTLEDDVISKKWDDFSYNGKIEKDTLEHAKDTVRNFQLFQLEAQIRENNKIITQSKDERLHLELLLRNKELQEEKKILQSQKTKFNDE